MRKSFAQIPEISGDERDTMSRRARRFHGPARAGRRAAVRRAYHHRERRTVRAEIRATVETLATS